MGLKDYIDTIARTPKELRAMQERAKKTGANKLNMRQIDSIIAEVRREQNAKRGTGKRQPR